MVNDFLGDISEVFLVVPELVEDAEVLLSVFPVHLVNEIHHVVAALTAQVGSREAVDRSICEHAVALDVDESLKNVVGGVGFKADFLANPVGAFYGDGFLGELIAEADFKLGTVEGALAVDTWNIEFPALLGFSFFEEGRSGENKAKFVNVFQLFFEFVERIYGEAGRGYTYLAALS